MKKVIFSIAACIALNFAVNAQAPEGFKYQSVIRDGSNTILNNQAVGMQLIIHQGSAGGSAVYTETFATTSNAYGLVNLEIGSGATSDNFAAIDWSAGPYFIETAADLTGGTSYTSMGTSQLMSVPYALHAKGADETDPVFAGSIAGGITAVDTANWNSDMDTDPTNELQVLSMNADTIFISGGNYVLLGGGAADADWDVVGNNMRAMPTGNISMGTNANNYNEKVTIGDTGLFRLSFGHAGNFNEVESGRLVFTEDVDFNGTCGFEWHHDGSANTLALESGCTTMGDTSIVFTRTGEVRIPERVRIGSNANPTADIHLDQSSAGTSPSSAGIRFYQPNTSANYWSLWNSTNDFSFGFNGTRVAYISTVGAYTQVSDRRAKENIVSMGNVLEKLLSLRPVEYNYKNVDNAPLTKGFIAQEVQEVFPELVNVSADGMMALPYDEFGVIAVKAIQEQQAIIDNQQKEIDELKAQVELLMKAVHVDNTPQIQSVDPVLENPYTNDADH